MIRTKKHINTFVGGIDADTVVTKADSMHYFDAENMRIISNDPSVAGAETNVVGNTLRLLFPVGDEILGHCRIRSNYATPHCDSIVFFTVNNLLNYSGIYLFEGDPSMVTTTVVMGSYLAPYTDPGSLYQYKSGHIYIHSGLNFSTPIKAEGRFESDNIRKVYWVDGVNNIRYMILDRVQMTDDPEIFNINPEVTLESAVITLLAGGSYTSGTIQHSYQLYVKNGAATAYAPVSNMLNLTANDGAIDSRGFGGSDLDSNSGKAVQVNINNLDPKYNRVRIVAIHYTEYLINPVVKIVAELEYLGTDMSFVDNGFNVLGTVPIEEFRLFGQTNYIANYLASKNNYLFYADVTQDKWTPPWLDPLGGNFFDSRAVRFKTGTNIAYLQDPDANVTINQPANVLDPLSWNTAGWSSYFPSHDGVNIYNSVGIDNQIGYDYRFLSDGITLGAEGPNVVVTFQTENKLINNDLTSPLIKVDTPFTGTQIVTDHVSSQRTEVYRMFLVFINTKMQYTDPQWICDLRMPNNNDVNTIYYDSLTRSSYAVNLFPTVSLRSVPNDQDLYGWQIFRCERGGSDRSVMANGIISAIFDNGTYVWPTSWIGLTATGYGNCFIKAEDYVGSPNQTDAILEIISPEIAFNKNLKQGSNDYVRIDGRYNRYNRIETAVNLPGGADSSRRCTLVMGETGPRTVNPLVEQNLYDATEGYFQAPAQYIGDLNTLPGSLIIPPIQQMDLASPKNYRHIMYTADPGVEAYGDRGFSFIAVIGNEDLKIDITNDGYLYGSYLRDVFYTQYNGNTYEARSFNSCIPYSPVWPKTNPVQTTVCYYGDTFITMFAYLRSAWPNLRPRATSKISSEEMIYFPTESSINCFYRLDQIGKYHNPLSNNEALSVILENTVEQGLKLQADTYPLALGDLYRYNSVYSKSANAQLLINRVFDSTLVERNDVMIIATGKKINNEYFDQWTNLYTNNNIQLDPKYGPIRNIFNFNNSLFVGQDTAISTVSVEERSMVQDQTQLQLVLGTGTVLSRYDYLTVTSGFQDYFDMALSDKGFYYVDRRNKTFYTLGGEGDLPLSEVKGYRSFLKSYAPIVEVKTGYDPVYKEVFFYVSDGSKMKNSVYGEYTSSFNGKHSFIPDRMLNLNDKFYSVRDNEFWIHNEGKMGEFYGSTYDSTITFIVNPNKVEVNRFDVLDLRVDVIDRFTGVYDETSQFDRMELSNNYQTTTKNIQFSGDDSSEDTSKSLARQWRTLLLPDDQSQDFYRFVDTYLKVKLIKDNIQNKKLVLHDAVTYVRPIKN